MKETFWWRYLRRKDVPISVDLGFYLHKRTSKPTDQQTDRKWENEKKRKKKTYEQMPPATMKPFDVSNNFFFPSLYRVRIDETIKNDFIRSIFRQIVSIDFIFHIEEIIQFSMRNIFLWSLVDQSKWYTHLIKKKKKYV